MAEQSQKAVTGTTVRIWNGPKKRLQKVREEREVKEGRPVSEAELVSKAVEAYCTKEERKLGIN
jgi:hypothetical protein